MSKKTLIIINFILISLLIAISIYEKYPFKIRKHIALLNSDLPSFWHNKNYRHEMTLYKHYHKTANIVMLGNSITYRANWNELLQRNDIINRGISGDITAGYIARLQHVYKARPKLCFIMGGINDVIQGIDKDTIVNNLLTISQKLKQNNIKPFLFSVLYVANTFPHSKSTNQLIQTINKDIKALSAENNILYIDVNEVLSENHHLKEIYSYDGIHLNGTAYQKWSHLLTPIIKANLPDEYR